ncbi:unnamed protein product [Didymodactylos carnosus]|uniref:AB hydrolase-1 domain-containing protein n=1 Tax=Didymodactylos carnosus TaxID=1234261 RepID=A0A813ZQ29_9BILA|nr:unnamed protein product [Didymodactylos carnosus]CAF0901600.1 unnamed protein product [Didymodactylos carnosus]CAF3681327.1 unnamed protein product [Didymodactylos carnosus]CAF3683954.1 unnamed protein product [Didymodactylos carnosus]
MSNSDNDSQFISVNNIQVYYKRVLPTIDNVQNNDHSIVLIHGFLCSTFTWQKILQPLANRTGCQVIAYDRLAFGLTQRIEQWDKNEINPYTRKGEELLALELFRLLNITSKLHLVSSSSGATVAYDIAVANPELVYSIILISPYGLHNVHKMNPISKWLVGTFPVKLLLKFGLKHYLPFKNAYFDENYCKDETVKEGYLRPIQDDPLFFIGLDFFIEYNGPSETTSIDHFLQIPRKILFIMGENDKLVSKKDVKEFYQLILNENKLDETILQYVSIQQCGHLPQEEKPTEVVGIISEFFEKARTDSKYCRLNFPFQ